MSKNEHGVYLDYTTETLAVFGRSRAEVKVARCDDGLFRFATELQHSSGGHSRPVMDHGEGYATHEEAKTAGVRELLGGWRDALASEPETVQRELRELKRQLQSQLRQPSLF